MAHIIMIHGSWSGGWMWDRVVPLLTEAGHTAEAPTLLGANPGSSDFPSQPISAWADQVAERVQAAQGPVVLVGQSRGGIVISEVAERVPDRVGYLVYVAAFLLPNGISLGAAVHKAHPDAVPFFTIDSVGMTTLFPDALSRIYSKTPAPWIEVARSNQCSEPLTAINTPIFVTEARFGSVRRAYVETSEDQILPLAAQRAMQAGLPCDPVFSIATDHVPPFSAPEELAKQLIGIASKVEASA
jgi:pimeloyl-ACP methyl ester carboxylesterase